MTKISKIKVQGVTHEIKDNEAYVKPVDGIPASHLAEGVIPDVSQFITKSVNDLTYYYTKDSTYSKTDVDNIIASISQFHYKVYATLPATGDSNILYLIGPTGTGSDKYEEYVYPSSTTGWVKIGDTSIDLSGYVTTTALNTALAAKQDVISDLAQIRTGAALGATALQSHQDISGKANKSEMAVSTSGDKTTITLKTGTSATVLNAHQDISGKVDKVSGKGLSTNDYTTDEKNKLSGIAAGAQVNVIETVKVNGTALTPSSKAVDVSVPTKVSQLTNDSGYTNNVGTITGITMNGASKGTSGVVNLGTVITSHQDISGKEDKSNKVTSVSSSSTDDQYPSAKAVYTGLSGKMDKMVNITWSNLKSLRDSGGLIPGEQYRITDYVTTTVQENTQSAGHVFDVIVLATDINKLSEEARAIRHAGDNYFANNNLNAWKIWYSIDNDTTRFAWADTTNGKGVIYWMKDEWNNECPYDFKNIQYVKSPILECRLYSAYPNSYSRNGDVLIIDGTTYYCYILYESTSGPQPPSVIWLTDNVPTTSSLIYTISNNVATRYTNLTINGYSADSYTCYTFSCGENYISDASLSAASNTRNNRIERYFTNNKQSINFIKFKTTAASLDCHNNTFGNNCHNNTFGRYCFNNTFGDSFYSNTFGDNCQYNSFGSLCYNNTFGDDCRYNPFGNNCHNNTFGNGCQYNTFGYGCIRNTSGHSFQYNSFGNDCFNNTFGDSFYYNTFGNGCQYIKFGDSSSTKNYCRYIIVENCNRYIYLSPTGTTSGAAYYQNVKIAQGVNNTYTWKTITDANVGQTYQTVYQPAASQTINV